MLIYTPTKTVCKLVSCHTYPNTVIKLISVILSISEANILFSLMTEKYNMLYSVQMVDASVPHCYVLFAPGLGIRPVFLNFVSSLFVLLFASVKTLCLNVVKSTDPFFIFWCLCVRLRKDFFTQYYKNMFLVISWGFFLHVKF